MLRNSPSPTLCLVATMLALTLASPSFAGKPIWSRKGVSFPAWCSPPSKDCRPLKIPSPNGRSAVEVSYITNPDERRILMATLRVTTLGKFVGTVPLVATADDEITWSPDSKAFFIDGNNNDYGDEHVAVHRLDDPKLGPGYITRQVEWDMERSFPPCKSKNITFDCALAAAKPSDYIGAVAIDWVGDSSRIVIMAEVPCSSSMGGIMCQVLGYEVQVPSGKILDRMQPKDFARRWQKSMAWQFHIPGPPEY